MGKLVGMVVCLLGLVLSMSKVNAIDCGVVVTSIFPCSSYLGSYLPIQPGAQCCDGLGSLVGTTVDTQNLCHCFGINPLAPGYIPSKAQQLPNLCNLSSFLPLVNCLIPSANNTIPNIPFPPLRFPFPPLLQSPLVSIPVIPNPPAA